MGISVTLPGLPDRAKQVRRPEGGEKFAVISKCVQVEDRGMLVFP